MHCAYDVIAESGPYNHFGQHIQQVQSEAKEATSLTSPSSLSKYLNICFEIAPFMYAFIKVSKD